LTLRLKKSAFFKTIQFKLSALFCSATIALSIMGGVTFYDYKKEFLFNQLKENAGNLSKNLAINAGAAVLDSDEMQLSVLVFTELKNPGVLSAGILDHEGKALIHSDIKKIGNAVLPGNSVLRKTTIPEKNQLKEIKPILVNGKKIGTALLTMDISPVLEKTAKLRMAIFTAALFFSGFGCYLIIHVIGNLLKPLGVLSQAAVKIGQGDLSVRVHERGGEELRKLGKVFNKMAQGLDQANQNAEEGYLQSVMALSAAVEASDPYTRGHCDRVAYYSEQVALHMGMDKASVKQLVLAGQLHDLGKIGIDKEILCKPGRLDSEEFDHIARHPMIAWEILEPVLFLSKEREIIIVHHERFDGKGYPNGLHGSQISLAGKILAVADCYDAMTSNRPYRRHMEEKKALGIIKEERGNQFDPDIVDAFLEAQPFFENRESLDERLEISSRGRVWFYDETFSKESRNKNPAVLN
jgi:HD-GYP domain-containing protein (c-di-GMP phosphodiesterase class II)